MASGPIIVAPGFFANEEQAVIAHPCAQSRFTPDAGSIWCSVTPAGFQNPLANATYPHPCDKGFFRNNDEVVFCQQCPAGYWAPDSRNPDEILCEPCPMGRVCTMTGTYNMSQSSPCLEGYVCDIGTRTDTQFLTPCEEGFACDFETTPLSEFNYPCPPGQVCDTGTTLSGRYDVSCPVGYWCPQAAFVALDGVGTRLIPDLFEISLDSLYGQVPYVTDLQTTCRPVHRQVHASDLFAEIYDWANTPLHFSGENRSFCGNSTELIYLPQTSNFSYYERIRHRCPYGTTTADVREHSFDACQPTVDGLVIARVNGINVTSTVNGPREWSDAQTHTVTLEPLEVLYFAVDTSFISKLLYNDNDNILHNQNYSFKLLDQQRGPHDAQEIALSEDVVYNANITDGVLNFSLSSEYGVDFNLSIEIIHGRSLHLLEHFHEAFEVTVSRPHRANIGTKNAFMAFVDEWESGVELPLNLPNVEIGTFAYRTSIKNTSAPFSTYNEDFYSVRTIKANTQAASRAWLLPYFPYFSNCEGFGSYIFLHEVFESEDYCDLKQVSETAYVGDFGFATRPISDVCNVETECHFEEQAGVGTANPYWFADLNLNYFFQVPSEPVDYNKFKNDPQAYTDYVKSLGESELKRVLISRDDDGAQWNLRTDMPRNVEMLFEYHQHTATDKRIINIELTLSNFSSYTDGDYYNLKLDFKPMSYWSLVNKFAFDGSVYFTLFIGVGVIQILFYFIVLLIHWFFRRYDVRTRFIGFLIMFTRPLCIAVLLLSPGFLILCELVRVIFATKETVKQVEGWWGEYDINWLDIVPADFIMFETDNSSDDFNLIALSARGGRIGLTFLTMGIFVMQSAMRVLMPDRHWKLQQRSVTEAQDYFASTIQSDKEEDERVTRMRMGEQADWTPMMWKRMFWICNGLVTLTFSIVIIEISFSQVFSSDFYLVFGGIKITQLIYNKLLTDSLSEDLLISPLTLSIEAAVFAATLSAPDFISFVLGHYIDVIISIIEGLYWEPFLEYCVETFQTIVDAVKDKFVTEDDIFVEKILLSQNTDNLGDAEAARVKEGLRKKVLRDNKSVEASLAKERQKINDSFRPAAQMAQKQAQQAVMAVQAAQAAQAQMGLIGQQGEQAQQGLQRQMTKGMVLDANTAAAVNTALQAVSQLPGMQQESNSQTVGTEGLSSSMGPQEESSEDESSAEYELAAISSVIGVIAGHVEGLIAASIAPFYVYLLIRFRDETALPDAYGIKETDMFFYLLFTLVMILPTILSSILLINTQGYMYGWNVFDYLVFCRYRFEKRHARWVADDPFTDLTIDTNSRSAHNFCFSEQYFALLYYCGLGLMLLVLSIEIFIQHGYSPFGDIMLVPIVLLTVFFCLLMKKVYLFFANMFGLWALPYNATIKEQIDAPDYEYKTPWQKLKDAEQEYMTHYNKIDTPRLQQPQFRMAFLRHNRDFIAKNVEKIVNTTTMRHNITASILQLSRMLGLGHAGGRSLESSDETTGGTHQGSDSVGIGSAMDSEIVGKVDRLLVDTRGGQVALYFVTIAKLRVLYLKRLHAALQEKKPNLKKYCHTCDASAEDINVDIRFEKPLKEAMNEFGILYMRLKKRDPFEPWILPFLANPSEQAAKMGSSFAAQKAFKEQKGAAEEILRDWIKFVEQDVGFEVLCDECYQDKLDDLERVNKTDITRDGAAEKIKISEDAKKVARMFLQMAQNRVKQQQQEKAQRGEYSVSELTETDSLVSGDVVGTGAASGVIEETGAKRVYDISEDSVESEQQGEPREEKMGYDISDDSTQSGPSVVISGTATVSGSAGTRTHTRSVTESRSLSESVEPVNQINSDISSDSATSELPSNYPPLPDEIPEFTIRLMHAWCKIASNKLATDELDSFEKDDDDESK